MTKKRRNMQPWLDYFAMLQTYVEKGFLQMEPKDHEVYITESALNALSNADVQTDDARRMRAHGDTVRRLRVYAGWKSMEGMAYMDRPFSVHVVRDDEPHDLVCTVLLANRRRWWSLWFKVDCFDVVSYTGKP